MHVGKHRKLLCGNYVHALDARFADWHDLALAPVTFSLLGAEVDQVMSKIKSCAKPCIYSQSIDYIGAACFMRPGHLTHMPAPACCA